MKTALIIEDNEQNLYLARFMLEQHGYQVEAAPDGPSGIVAALRLRPSIILLDIQLPGMDGHEVARRLRGHTELDAIPIVAVTSYAMAGDRERILAAGCTGYIEKPINPATFASEIDGILERSQVPRDTFRVIVADDLEANREIMRLLLEAEGWKVSCAGTGNEVLTLARRELPDLVVSDILMPGLDGFGLCREWRRDRRLSPIPFVFCTATYTDEQDERFGLNLGADAFLTKPIEPHQLVRRLHEIVGRQRTPPVPAPAPVVPPQPDEKTVLREYNAVLIRKLEDKMRQLESVNRELEVRVRERTQELEKANLELQAFGRLGTWSWEPDSKGLHWSVETCRIFGIPADQFDGRPETFFERVHPDDRETVRNATAKAWAGMQTFNLQHRIVRPDGELRWLQQDAELERDQQQQPARLMGIVRDVTEHRLLEEQLRQAQKMEAVGQLAGGVAHDFNNLLTVIRGHTALLQSLMGLPAEAQDSLKEIGGAAERASNLTRQLLAFSRRQPLELRLLDLNRVVTDMARMLRSLVGERIMLQEQLTADLPGVYADAAMLEQVVMNLVVNARDAMSRGGELTLRTSVVDLDSAAAARLGLAVAGRYVCLAVCDNGCGIDSKHLPYIFDPFFTTKASDKGTGLGLAMVYSIVQRHDGHIIVQSQPGTGTTFTIYLPASNETPKSAAKATEARPGPVGSEALLIVEDEAAVRGLVRDVLRRHGYRVFEAENAERALVLWQAHKEEIALVLTDLVMPGQFSGSELVERIRKDRPRIKVILTSGYSPESIEVSSDHDQLAFLQKPYHPEALLQLVRENLDRR